jgi:uncharacterized damage-inducible protein DinB
MGTPLKKLLSEEIEKIYKVTENLFRKVHDSELSWKPTSGTNWMTLGQLLMHCASGGCGLGIRGLIKGDWGPAGNHEHDDREEINDTPKAEDLPYVDSVEEAITILKDDMALALSCIGEAEESELLSKKMVAPWGVLKMTLLQHLLIMIAHLAQHKGQLFYYLKLMGKDVSTVDLWGEM